MNATFALSRKLLARGHRVVYACIPDVETRIRAQGFEYVPIFERVFPRGSLDQQYDSEAKGKSYGLNEFKARLRGMCELLRDDEIGHATRDISPDLLLVSSGMPWVGIGAQRTGLPVICFSSTLISVYDPIVPPFGTNIVPGKTPLWRLRTRFDWERMFARRRFRGWAWDISGELNELARDCDFPLDKIDYRVETWPRLLLPELVFCPKHFDFPRALRPEGAIFVEASVDTARKDSGRAWSYKLDDRPLVYCSLGSVATIKYASRAAKFFQTVMDAIGHRPSLQAVVAVGNYLAAGDFTIPENVTLVNEAPQVDILKRASLMIYHGGIGGVKESIFMGVPMLLIPLFYDQAGNAARVIYHHLGERLELGKLTDAEMGRGIDRLLEDPSYSEHVKLMAEKFVDTENRAPSVDVIESVLAGGPVVPPDLKDCV
jgi:MGT family glycosyltransferase